MTIERRQERQEEEGNGGGADTQKELRAQRQWTKWRGLELAWVIQMDSDGWLRKRKR